MDVRPALDGVESIKERVVVGLEEGWRGLWRNAEESGNKGFTEKGADERLNNL